MAGLFTQQGHAEQRWARLPNPRCCWRKFFAATACKLVHRWCEYLVPTFMRTRLSAVLRRQLPPPEARGFVALRAAIGLAAKVDRSMEEPPCPPAGSAPCPDCGIGSRRR